MLSLKASKVRSLIKTFGTVYGGYIRDELKGSIWRMHKTSALIWVVHFYLSMKENRGCVCFDKVNNGPTHSVVSEQVAPYLYSHSACGQTHHELRGKLAMY